KLNRTDELPPTVVYSLNAGDDDKLASVLGCFQEGSFPQKMQLGAPWWFSDHRDGMRKQMKALANTGLLSGFIGMLTDSRSFLSYARHEYFRRVLCDLLGSWMEQGDIPSDESLIGEMIANICFGNSAAYFGLK
ncbi:MAG: glucuronate isomerase, partial [Eubacteriales bacterium]